MSTPARRVPQQERGERRVAQVLDAAAALIAENGYDAATMTQIAERADSCIGALYQYFPNKEAVAWALRLRYADEMERRWTLLQEAAGTLSTGELVDHLIDVMVDFMENHPAYIPLLDAPRGYRRDQRARARLRENFAKLICGRNARLTAEEAFRTANVAIQIIKSLKQVYAEAKPKEREDLVREYKLALSAYLERRVGL